MNPIPINLAVEDMLSEVVARRLLQNSGRNFALGVVFNRGGNGYLRKLAPGWNSAAKGIPFLFITDLDSEECPATLLRKWLPNGIDPNMLARVAVREVEAWLLADHVNFSKYLKISSTLLPADPDKVPDPKATLVRLASRSTVTQIKKRLVPVKSSTAKQGRDYNACLAEFVTSHWDVASAAKVSSSLEHCVRRLSQFQPAWT